MNKPFFSIVTAIKDGLDLFKETAPTIVRQTFGEWEWLVVDDASEDDIGGYLRTFNDERIRVFKNTHAVGQTRSLNFGIQQSNAKWIVRMDGDDLSDLRRLEVTRARIIQRTTPIRPLVFSDYNVIGECGEYLTTVRYKEPLQGGFYDYLSQNNPICHPSVTFYKFSPHGEVYFFDETLKNAQDFALWKRMRADYGEFLHVAEPLISYRLVRRALSGARILEQREELRLIRETGSGEKSTDAAAVKPFVLPTVLPTVLNEREQDGMYAFRVLYYRFVGDSGTVSVSIRDDLASIMRTLKFPSVFLKSAFFLFLRPFKNLLKTVLFHNIYK